MGGSGLLVVGVVLLWLFGAMPHWVRRREELAHSSELVEADSRELVLAGRSGSRASAVGGSSDGLLGRPRPVTSPVQAEPGGGRTQGKAPASRPAVPVAGRAPRRRRGPSLPVRVALAAVALAVVAAPPVLLVAAGAPTVTAALAGLACGAFSLVALRLRARRRSVARTAVLRRAGVRRSLALVEDEGQPRTSAAAGRRPQRTAEPRRHAVGA